MKIVSRYEKGEELPWELYNLKEDRTETIDLSKIHVEKLKELIHLYHSTANEVQAIPYRELQQKRKMKQ